MLTGFGALAVVAAVGFELRTRSDELDFASHLLLMLNALVLAWAGWAVLPTPPGTPGSSWLAVAHLAVAATGNRLARVSHALVLGAAGIGIVLADVAFASVVDGLPLVAGWAGARSRWPRSPAPRRAAVDSEFALAGLGGQLGLALGHTLVYEAPPGSVGGPRPRRRRRARARRRRLLRLRAHRAGRARPLARIGLDATALALVGYLGAVVLEGRR